MEVLEFRVTDRETEGWTGGAGFRRTRCESPKNLVLITYIVPPKNAKFRQTQEQLTNKCPFKKIQNPLPVILILLAFEPPMKDFWPPAKVHLRSLKTR